MIFDQSVYDEIEQFFASRGRPNDELSKTQAFVPENCTVSHLITSVPGSSDYFHGSIVSYSNDVKESLLKVAENDLINYGAVSEQVVVQMANGSILQLNSDYSIATSGIAGR